MKLSKTQMDVLRKMRHGASILRRDGGVWLGGNRVREATVNALWYHDCIHWGWNSAVYVITDKAKELLKEEG